jgi:archaellum component FlaC
MKICDAGHVEIIYEEYTRGRRIACPVCDAKTEIDAYLKEIDDLIKNINKLKEELEWIKEGV